ncbi:hypothetical protein [Streptomyces sp. 8L]|uniref:hypothetical protein n=1 Tax=Streptomyces sp. 8L TaxID=2877242 RepID=UPI001CD332A2|nr:hypothetical protein [Streptomyces sp. 8L]MCA1222561.1 hypothetical protein [Streptomyces sp. 8L]
MERISFFFEVTEWEGQPVNREPDKCTMLQWFTVHELPADIIEYPAAGLNGYLQGSSSPRPVRDRLITCLGHLRLSRSRRRTGPGTT